MTKKAVSDSSPKSDLQSKTWDETILIAVTGMSPAVLTETLWALAQETPPVIPDKIIVLTTLAGKETIKSQLFGTNNIWSELRAALLGSNHENDSRLTFSPDAPDVVTFTQMVKGRRVPLKNISSLEENNVVADCILDELWKHSAKTNNRIIASIAGGYKSMSALMMSCLSLLGRVQDRVTHVLVDVPYDEPRLGFFFPLQGKQVLETCSGIKVIAKQAKIRMFDVPWVPFRVLFERNLKEKPASYSKFVEKLRGGLPKAIIKPEYHWDNSSNEGRVTYPGSEPIFLTHRPAVLFEFLWQRALKGETPYTLQKDSYADFKEFLSGNYGGKDIIEWKYDEKFTPQELSATLQRLRNIVPDLVLPKGGNFGLTWCAK